MTGIYTQLCLCIVNRVACDSSFFYLQQIDAERRRGDRAEDKLRLGVIAARYTGGARRAAPCAERRRRAEHVRERRAWAWRKNRRWWRVSLGAVSWGRSFDVQRWGCTTARRRKQLRHGRRRGTSGSNEDRRWGRRGHCVSSGPPGWCSGTVTVSGERLRTHSDWEWRVAQQAMGKRRTGSSWLLWGEREGRCLEFIGVGKCAAIWKQISSSDPQLPSMARVRTAPRTRDRGGEGKGSLRKGKELGPWMEGRSRCAANEIGCGGCGCAEKKRWPTLPNSHPC